MINHPRPISPTEISEYIGRSAHPVILEIGCNDGTDSLSLLTIPGVRLHCFECDPRPIVRFYEKVLKYADGKGIGEDGREVTLHQLALGAEKGTATFHQSGGTTQGAHLEEWDLSGSLKKPLGHKERTPWCTFERTIEVDVTTLDAWAANLGITGADFIWMDVQGAEGDVITGGKRFLCNTRYLYCEFNSWKKPLYEGDLSLDGTLAALGPAWEPVALYQGYNVLCCNTQYEGA